MSEPSIAMSNSRTLTSSSLAVWRNPAVVVEWLVVFGVYVAAGEFGLRFGAVFGFATLVWAPTGIALAALLLRGFRLWPAIALGALITNVLAGAPFPVAMGIAAGNTLEALAGAYALRSVPGFTVSLDRLIDAFALILAAAIASTAVSASVGVFTLYLGGIVPAAGVAATWRAWWLGDVIGNLLVAPVILVWSRGRPTANREQWLEAGTLGVCIAAVCILIFGKSALGAQATAADAYLFFPLFMWAALRFGQRGAVTTAFIVSVVAIWATVNGHGPFVERQLINSLFSLQTFMAVTAATFLVLGASVNERSAAVDRLQSAISGEEMMVAERDAAHQRLIAVLEQTPVAIGIVDAETGRFLFTNDEVQRVLGIRPRLTPANAANSDWSGFHTSGEQLQHDEWPVWRAIHRGEIVRDEVIRLVRRNAEPLELLTNAAPVRDVSGNIVAAVLVFRDVTAQRRAEDELRRAHEAAAAANHAKSEFLAVMSHELRTPLNAIGGHIQLIEMGVHGPVTEPQREALGRVQRSQRHLLALINDLLNLSRIETGRVDYELAEVPLEPLVAEAVKMIEPLLSSHSLTCDVVDSPYAPDPAIQVRADRDKAQQILLNLLNNAVKFTPPGGHITVEVTLDDATRMACVRVKDSGVGIPAEKLETIFEPFVQLGSRMSAQNGGLGLGLSISRDLARGMGGSLVAESTVGEGSIFTLLLPLA